MQRYIRGIFRLNLPHMWSLCCERYNWKCPLLVIIREKLRNSHHIFMRNIHIPLHVSTACVLYNSLRIKTTWPRTHATQYYCCYSCLCAVKNFGTQLNRIASSQAQYKRKACWIMDTEHSNGLRQLQLLGSNKLASATLDLLPCCQTTPSCRPAAFPLPCTYKFNGQRKFPNNRTYFPITTHSLISLKQRLGSRVANGTWEQFRSRTGELGVRNVFVSHFIRQATAVPCIRLGITTLLTGFCCR
jgi:hypothetical protein